MDQNTTLLRDLFDYNLEQGYPDKQAMQLAVREFNQCEDD